MSTVFKSTLREIKYPQQDVYRVLSDFSNIERLKSRIPANEIESISFDENSLNISTPMGDVSMETVERIEPQTLKFASSQSPLPFELQIEILPVDANSCKLQLSVNAEINPFIKSMVKKPLQDGLEKIADALQKIDFHRQDA